MNLKKITYIILITLAVFTLAACKKNNAKDGNDLTNDFTGNATVTSQPVQPTQAPTVAAADTGHEGEMKSYLTGEWISKDLGTNRPYAFAFNNFKTVKNQWGISQADIVYECLVEGGITRLLGVGQSFKGDRIGSTRSARHYFVSIADEYDAIYIHFGGTKYARAKVAELGVDELDGINGTGAGVFYRDNSIRAPHNAFATLSGIQKGIKRRGYETKLPDNYEPHFNFYDADTDLTGGSSANKVAVTFSGYNLPHFEYSSSDKLYYRFQFGGKHIDSNTGKQLAFKNIIIQYVKEWNIDKKGYQTMDLANATGKGLYITNGKSVPITWKKNEAKSWMRYYDADGKELTINPGKTYIALFPNSRPKDVKVQ